MFRLKVGFSPSATALVAAFAFLARDKVKLTREQEREGEREGGIIVRTMQTISCGGGGAKFKHLFQHARLVRIRS